MILSQSLNAAISFCSPLQVTVSTDQSHRLIVDGIGGDCGSIVGQIRFRLLVDVQFDGQCFAADNRLVLFSCTSIVLRIVVATSYLDYNHVDRDQIGLAQTLLDRSLDFSFDDLFSRHIDDYRRLFDRVQINLGESEAMRQPTDRRIELYAKDPSSDPQLVTLYFQFGRYLLLCSSRIGSQPATLQGIWNDSINPPWQSKYTININIPMNYWPAGPANLLDCYPPLFDLIEDLSHTGQSTAQKHYGTVSIVLLPSSPSSWQRARDEL
jgi:alpha-L-fucosidase 2